VHVIHVARLLPLSQYSSRQILYGYFTISNNEIEVLMYTYFSFLLLLFLSSLLWMKAIVKGPTVSKYYLIPICAQYLHYMRPLLSPLSYYFFSPYLVLTT